MKARTVCLSVAIALAAGVVNTPTAPARTNIPYVEAQSIIEALQQHLLPPELRGRTSAERGRSWPGWVSQRDRTIRARIARGDEDSIVNFLLLGTTFTIRPRVTDIVEVLHDASGAEVLQQRLDDMMTGLAAPGGNERLQFTREVIERKGITPATAAGRRQARLYLADMLGRVARERQGYQRSTEPVAQLDTPIANFATHSTLYHDRGLSSDTSIFPSFAIEQALTAIGSGHLLGDGPIRRVAIVGPGLDFTDKEDGYDFYPLQTIQPFATIDSLIRLGFATPHELQITTFDLSSRVNHHLQAVRQRARGGDGYTLTLTRNTDEHWTPELVSYWRRVGDRIGEDTPAVVAPSNAGNVQVRAVRVRPAIVMSTTAEDVNVVLQRLESSDPRERFDLIIATNVLVYYDVFEQSLALANLAKMLRRGGLLLSNNLLYELPATPMNAVDHTDVAYTDGGNGDRIEWYQRQ